APKEWVMKAIKLEIAHLFLLNSHSNEEITRPLINAAMFLDSFSELPFEPSEFIESMHRRRREMDSYYVELLKLDRGDAFYWQRVYAMIGIDVGTNQLFESKRQVFNPIHFGRRAAFEKKVAVRRLLTGNRIKNEEGLAHRQRFRGRRSARLRDNQISHRHQLVHVRGETEHAGWV